MSSTLCRLLNFLLRIGDAILTFVGSAFEIVADATIRVLGAVGGALGSIAGSVLSGPLGLLGLGLLAFFLLGKDKKTDGKLPPQPVTRELPQSSRGSYAY